MRKGLGRVLRVAAAGMWLAGCSAANSNLSDAFGVKGADAGPDSFAAAPPTGEAQIQAEAEAPAPLGVSAADAPEPLGGNPLDDVGTGKKYFRAGNYGMAERYFRRAAEQHPRDAEAWLDLAASYDRLRRFELADRAYGLAIQIVGPTVAILNNQGYSYMLRGDVKGAHEKLDAARRKDPANKFVLSNLKELEVGYRNGKMID